VTVADNIEGNGGAVTVTDPFTGLGDRLFYRLRLLP
jgi:hypothetical protein